MRSAWAITSFGNKLSEKEVKVDEGFTGKNKFLPKFVNILEKLWKTEFSLNITNVVIFYFQEYSSIRNI